MEENEKTTFRHYIVYKPRSGPSFMARSKIDSTALSGWTLLFDEHMLEAIVEYTKQQASLVELDWKTLILEERIY